MKPLDNFSKQIVSEENAMKFLNKKEYEKFLSLTETDREHLLKELLSQPISGYTVVNELYFRYKWAELIQLIYGSNPITLVEVASGDADMIPQTLARSNPSSRYITANMNKNLNENILNKIRDLNLDFCLIDDDAINIKKYMSKKTVDLIAFQHGVNDVLQAILCGRAQIDTIDCDWMELLPKMIELVQHEIQQGTFEQNTKLAFLKLMTVLAEELKDGGVLAISHYMFQLDLDLGYPAELFENLVPIIRRWLSELENCEEIFFENFDSQWWLFLRKSVSKEEL